MKAIDKRIFGIVVVSILTLLLMIGMILKLKTFWSSKENFMEANLFVDDLGHDRGPAYDPEQVRDYETYFMDKEKIEDIRIHAYKVKNQSSWAELGLYKYDTKNSTVSKKSMPINRIKFSSERRKQFQVSYESVGKPCVITNAADAWPASRLWSFEYMNDVYGDCKFVVDGEQNEMKFKYWYYYAKHPKHRRDDDPIYIFDQRFYERKRTYKLLKDYKVPSWFKEDDLSILPESMRPPYIWILMGIPRSGSSLHVDPLGTHAWNTLIIGKKRWVLFPPETKFTEEEQNLSGHRWFNEILPKHDHLKHYDFIQARGETLFLPANWWHVTLVIEDSICITQNYINKSNRQNAKKQIMKERPKVHRYWMNAIGESIPKEQIYLREDVYDSTESEMESDDEDEDEDVDVEVANANVI